jgi:hypothetical protein
MKHGRSSEQLSPDASGLSEEISRRWPVTHDLVRALLKVRQRAGIDPITPL